MVMFASYKWGVCVGKGSGVRIIRPVKNETLFYKIVWNYSVLLHLAVGVPVWLARQQEGATGWEVD